MKKSLLCLLLILFNSLYFFGQDKAAVLDKENKKVILKDSIDYSKKYAEEIIKKKETRQTVVNQRKKINDSLNLMIPKKIIPKDSIDYFQKFSDELMKSKNERMSVVAQRKTPLDSINKSRLAEIRNKKNNPKTKVVVKEETPIAKAEIKNEPKEKEIAVVANDSIKKEVLIVDETTSFKTIFDQGKKELENEDYQKALDHFNECIKRKYYDVYSVYYKGITLRKMKRYDDAIQAFRDLFSLDNTFFVTYYEIGKIHLERKEYDYALYNFNQYAKQNPHSHETHYYKALIYFETKKEKSALDEIMKAINGHYKNGDYFLLAGKIRLFLKSKSAACLDFQKAFDLKNQDALKFINDNCIKKT
jgi:tetratricopeptide (TPR) repeat protein